MNCSVEGCERPHKARGWCAMHYQRWREKGDLGAADLQRHGNKGRRIQQTAKPQWFPAAPVRSIFDKWFHQQEFDGVGGFGQSGRSSKEDGYLAEFAPINRLAMDADVTPDLLYKLKADRTKKYIDFDMADRIIQAINPQLWRTDADLAKAYQEFDLARLDAHRDCRPLENAA